MHTTLLGDWDLTCGKLKCRASIPGDFHTSLLNSKLIPDPYFGFNEKELQFLNQADFTIERSFSYTNFGRTRAILHIEEADTIFSVFINGKFSGSGDNQFVVHKFDITDFLNDGQNKIKIVFYSAENAAKKENENLPYPVPCAKYDVYSPHRNLIRKSQCAGGWDWGPCLMTSGIYKDIFIETVSLGLFESLQINFNREKNKKSDLWTVLCDATFDSFLDTDHKFMFTLSGPNNLQQTLELDQYLKKGQNKIHAEFQVENPIVWKTAGELLEEGLSENQFYEIEVSQQDKLAGQKSFSKKFCFSALKCVSFKENDGGRPIYFENDGKKIFAKGANWIPADALPSRQTDKVYINLLTSTVKANMNCLRVWGGGIYEKDIFYELCDKFGIIVWQDFMFACGLYPVTDKFMENVKSEVEYQILRLQHHACIGLWCGNNENFGTLNWFPESRNNRDRYLVDYDRLYQGLIGKIVKKLDPSRLWWPSSPCAGPDDFADNWHQDNMGDMHYWSVWHEKKNFSAYLDIKPRFVSEFGYESFPSIECVKTYAKNNELNFTSPVNEYHQRSPSGNSLMLESFSRYFRFPNGFENMVYLSQVQQADAIRIAVDYWRSLMPYCMGALFWQLNDVWPCPSWSSIEYNGRWKLLHYAAKDFFELVHLSGFIKDDKIQFFICNDLSSKISCELKVDFYDFDGNKISRQILKKTKAMENESKEILSKKVSDLKIPPETYFIYAKLSSKTVSGKIYESTSTIFLTEYKKCEIQKAKISLKFANTKSGVEITISANKPAFFVSLDNHNIKGTFSKNCFTVVPSEPLKIKFESERTITADELKSALTLKDLRQTY